MDCSPSSPLSPSSASLAEPLTIGMSSPGNSYLAQELAYFHFNQLEQLGVVDHVDFVQIHDDVGHPDLAGQKNVLAGLRHRAVGGRHDQDRAVHLRGAGDHVLHIVGMPGAVDVRIVARLGLVLDVRGVDGDAARLFLGGRINLVVGPRLTTK
jgi:hypothetical protein